MNLDRHIKELRACGEYLAPFNFPKGTLEDDSDFLFLKLREIVIDGYNIIVYYNKAEWLNNKLITLQIMGKYTPFLPFSLVCKIVKRFLGDKNLSFVDFMLENTKVYCWTLILDDHDNSQPAVVGENYDVESCKYDGLEYLYLNQNKVTFY